MYRNIVCVAAALILLLMGSVSAEPRAMTTEDAVIGGIAPGNDLGYVQSIYGSPKKGKVEKTQGHRHYLVHYYGSGFIITYNVVQSMINPLVQRIESTNSALLMPSGIHVGMKIGDVKQIFNNLEERPAVDKKYAKDYLTPFGTLTFSLPSGEEGVRFVVFTVDQKDIVKKILITDKYAEE